MADRPARPVSRRWLATVALAALLCGAAPGLGAPPDVKEAIVKIYTIHISPDYYNPWNLRGTFSTTGSGCILKGRRILTNAHVVSDQTFIQVRRFGQARRFQARVLSVAHAADLALLAVDDPEFFEGAEELELGDLPRAQQEVLVYGFPLGGDTLSITKGVVSRVEHQTYMHSSTPFIAVQIDAAVNPGNSGGPALSDGRVAGVTMQGISQADNIGYIIPTPVIRHFLSDLEDGRYDGFPSAGILMQGMESPALKAMRGMTDDQTGMLVVKTIPGSPAAGALDPGDVLLSIEGRAIADDGTIEFRPKERTSLSHLVQEKQIGQPVRIEILRGGEKKTVELKLTRVLEQDRLIPLEQYDILPTYFIYGGVVFCPLTLNLLKAWGPNWGDTAPEKLVAMLEANQPTVDRDEVVLALKVLPADVNKGYHDIQNWVVEGVQGSPVRNLRELIVAVEAWTNSPYMVFTDAQGTQIVLDRAAVEKSRQEILDTYRIVKDRSADLMDKP